VELRLGIRGVKFSVANHREKFAVAVVRENLLVKIAP
jgi:hypothetical protein